MPAITTVPRQTFTEQPDVDIRYGAATWRPQQTIIDILQNHLDAQQTSTQGALPSLKLLMISGDSKRWIDVNKASELDDTWKVTGFRVQDDGSGFHHGFLGVMGGSSKQHREDTRGGLGEGLKMSIAHLVREHAQVRLVSFNPESTWYCEPEVVGGALQFTGKQTNPAINKRGSITEVVFTEESENSRLMSEMLDPRRQGIGRYVLDYNNTSSLENIHISQCLPDVKPAAAYVKGLWVQDLPDAICSYNFSDKWTISGRDRSRVKEQALKERVQSILENCSDPQVPKNIFAILKKGKACFELELLNDDYPIEIHQKNTITIKSEIESLRIRTECDEPIVLRASTNKFTISPEAIAVWRKAAEEEFGIGNKKLIIVPKDIPYTALARIQDNGYEVLKLKISPGQQSFIDKLFPGEVVTWNAYAQLYERNDLANGLTLPNTLAAREDFHTQQTASLRTLEFVTKVANILVSSDAFPNSLKFKSYNMINNAGLSIISGSEVKLIYKDKAPVISVPENLSKPQIIQLVSCLLCAFTNEQSASARTQDIATDLMKANIGEIAAISSPVQIQEQIGVANLREQIINDPAYRDSMNNVAAMASAHQLQLQPDYDLEVLRSHANFLSGTRLIRTDTEVKLLSGEDTSIELLLDLNKKSTPINLLARWHACNLEVDHSKESTFRITVDHQENKPYILRLGQKNGNICFSVEGNESYQVHVGRGQINVSSEFTVTLDFGVVTFLKNGLVQNLKIEKVDSQHIPQINQVDLHHGKDRIIGSIDISYGKRVWNKPLRPLLDCLQNHMDASDGKRPEINFTVRDLAGNTLHVNEEKLRELPESTKIIGFQISDEGTGFSSHQLLRLGASTKTPKDRGQYGEGLKLLICACTRNAVQVDLESNQWKASATTEKKSLPDFEKGNNVELELLAFDLKWANPITGSRTSFSAEANQVENKFWEELVDLVDPRQKDPDDSRGGIDRFVLSEAPRLASGCVEVLSGAAGRIYENGLMLSADPHSNIAFSYNYLGQLSETRERDIFSGENLSQAIAGSTRHFILDPTYRAEVMRQMLGKKRACVESKSIGFSNQGANNIKAGLRLGFEEVAGDRAIISSSLMAEMLDPQQYYDSGLSVGNFRGQNGDIEAPRIINVQHKKEVLAAAAIEPHLAEIYNLVTPNPQFYHLLTSVGLPDSMQILRLEQTAKVDIGAEASAAAIAVIREADAFALRRIAELKADPNTSKYLDNLGIKYFRISKFESEVATRSEESIEWRTPAWPSLGECQSRGYAYNSKLLATPNDLYATHLHEIAHTLSGLPDYTPKFQQVLLLFAPKSILDLA